MNGAHPGLLCLFRPRLLCLLVAVQAAQCSAQMAPGGHTGALNTPTADVLPLGTVELSLHNNNPEIPRRHAGAGPFGSAVLGFGPLPGLEVAARLANDGDLHCNQFRAGCRSSLRDVSVNAKYQWPGEGPLNSRVALGFNDYGGAATHFKQAYGVLTARWEPLEWSWGYSMAGLPTALMQGSFKNATLHLSDRLKLKVEDDGTRRRAGASWQQKLGERLVLGVTISRQTSGPSALQKNQFGMGLQWSLEDSRVAQGLARGTPASDAGFHGHDAALQHSPRPESRPEPAVLSEAQRTEAAQELARHWAKHGFRHIHVASERGRTLRIKAEPVAWRKNRSHALGAALGSWLSTPGDTHDRLELMLTYLQQPVQALSTTRECAHEFLAGSNDCHGEPALQFQSPEQAASPADWTLANRHASTLHPELELGLATAYTVGTEYGLWDYSLGLDLGLEVPLARGLLWQGNLVTPLAHSDDFGPPSGYWKKDRISAGVQTSLLSYQARLVGQLWGQLSTGQITPHTQGQQLNLSWLDPTGRTRITGIQGHYHSTTGPQTMQPQLLSARYSLLPGLWSLDLSAGRFFNGDRGLRLMSDHWLGEHRLTFYIRETASADRARLPRTRFAGFELTIPLGPRQSQFIGPVSLRGRDQFPIGLSTKVGAKDNYITPGYGLVPMLRHGLNDIMNHDRSHLASPSALHQMRSVMQQVYQASPP